MQILQPIYQPFTALFVTDDSQFISVDINLQGQVKNSLALLEPKASKSISGADN